MKTIREEVHLSQKWKKSDSNRWADYIELRCIYDGLVTVSDIVDLRCEVDFDNEYDRGGSEHHKNSDELEIEINDYFQILESRQNELNEYYPFEVNAGLIKKKEWDDKYYIYIYLLVCSSIALMEKTESCKYTDNFECYCKSIMRILVPSSSEVELFGTSRDSEHYKGNLRARIKTLAADLGTMTSKSFDKNEKYDLIMAGDDGIDIVSFLPIDNAQCIPFVFAQCTCSYDKWKDKQASIDWDKWSNKMDLLPVYGKYMFVPFSCHDAGGGFYDGTSITSFLIDRIRQIKVISKDDELLASLIKGFEEFSVNALEYNWALKNCGVNF